MRSNGIGRLSAIGFSAEPVLCNGVAFGHRPVYDAAMETTSGVNDQGAEALYGKVPDGLHETSGDALQCSPLEPGAKRLEDWREASADAIAMLAPAGTIERRYALALALRALAPDGRLTAMAPKLKGGARLGDELRRFGCTVEETAKRHHRICVTRRPAGLDGIGDAVAAGAPRLVEGLGLWSQPGIFSWDRIDPGSAVLMDHLPALSGRGADFGCGIGVLAHAALKSAKVKHLTLLDVDRRAVEAAERNVADPRATVRWVDLARSGSGLTGLDFIVMNPPFHHGGGSEDQSLGQSFIRRAAEALRNGGTLWLTANRHLPYEAVLKPAFKDVTARADALGFKVYEARK